ncbi:hypothetical protein HDU83_001439 [Entophlyctis luteolus]|nr:hypothetical protein HDU83_001439 [Entophlyctis luteolus]
MSPSAAAAAGISCEIDEGEYAVAHVRLADLVHTECPSLRAGFTATPWLASGHLQTVYTRVWASECDNVHYAREPISLPDGGVVAIDWAPLDHRNLPPTTPIIVLLHGIGGGSRDKYILDMIPEILKRGYKAAALNSRGCNGLEIETPQIYSGSWTSDVRAMIHHIRSKFGTDTPIVGVGFSLGANIMTKYVGEDSNRCVLDALVSVANPYDFLVTSSFLEATWIGREVYSRAMANSVVSVFKKHANMLFSKMPNSFSSPMSLSTVTNVQYLREFDQHVTRSMFGYRSASEYYRSASSVQYLADISIPSLLLSDLDDPIALRPSVPYDDVRANPNIVLALTRRGGHIGWFEGWIKPRRWFPKPILEFSQAIISAKLSRPPGTKSDLLKSALGVSLKHPVYLPPYMRKTIAANKKATLTTKSVGTMTELEKGVEISNPSKKAQAVVSFLQRLLVGSCLRVRQS